LGIIKGGKLKNRIVDKIEFITYLCKDKRVVDLGFLNHSATNLFVAQLHQKVCNCASKVIGVDIEKEEVQKVCNGILKNRKDDIFVVDITKELPTSLLTHYRNYFDIVLACDLIEHLDNPSGLFSNCCKLLRDDGILILTTPNPFYIDLWLYTWLKNSVNVNPQHVSWICPWTMEELAERNGFYIKSFHWLKGRWNLGRFILQTNNHYYDHAQAKWVNTSFIDKIGGGLLRLLWSSLRWLLTVLSPLNKYSDYLVIMQIKKDSEGK